MSVTMSKSIAELIDFVNNDLEQLEENILDDILQTVKRKTPTDTDTAKAGWKKVGKEIKNDVPYSGYLETGTVHNRPIRMVDSTIVNIDGIVRNNIT